MKPPEPLPGDPPAVETEPPEAAAIIDSIEAAVQDSIAEAARRDSIAAARRDSIAVARRDSLEAVRQARIAAAARRDSIAAARRDSIAAARRDSIAAVRRAAARLDSIAAAERDSLVVAALRDSLAAVARRDSLASPETALERLRTAGPEYVSYDEGARLVWDTEAEALLATTLLPVIRAEGLDADVTTNLWLLVRSNGRVEATVVQTSSGNSTFDSVAGRAARALVFAPALRDGRAVPIWVLREVSLLMR
ncbi:energy transducer TonB [Candidatus Palauibacter sp.]|uniref:energy transducer TonB n=1 Tax=Candidatus Palauibacter sp. TaxID=3101350 RepID=UPI003AF2B871